VTCAVDCSRARLVATAVYRCHAPPRGRVAFVGESMDDLAIRISPDMIRKGLTVAGSWLYNLGDYPKVMQVIQQSPLIRPAGEPCHADERDSSGPGAAVQRPKRQSGGSAVAVSARSRR